MKKIARKKHPARNLAKASSSAHKLPLIEHLKELKRRLFYVAVSIAAGSAVAYALERPLIDALLRPSHGQHFIYTSPMGGMNFLVNVCIYLGVAVSIPVIVYQFLRFLQSLMHDTTSRFILIGSMVSGVIALAGMTFGYFFGLPAALHFLLHQFVTAQVQPLVTIQAYFSFVMAYMVGAALMFQLPLILLFINRIKPLKPNRLFHYERHVIVFAFIIGFIMNPTPNLLDQMFVVLPIILMYQVGIGVIWFVNHGSRQAKVRQLIAQDQALQAARAERASQLKPLPLAPLRVPAAQPNPQLASPSPAWTAKASPVISINQKVRVVRSRQYLDGMVGERTTYLA